MHRAFNNAKHLHPIGEDTLMKSKALKAAALALSCALAGACVRRLQFRQFRLRQL